MAIAPHAAPAGAWTTIAALVALDGSATLPVVHRFAASGAGVRDLSDAVHAICALHGRHPGVLDHALARESLPPVRRWLTSAAAIFADERSYLARLTASAGPLPSTPGQAESEAAVASQRHAFDMLAQSDRTGCATGAAIALLLDWRAIRAVLDAAARRFGVIVPTLRLPGEAEAQALLNELAPSAGAERALAFGAQQVLAQHRGLWQLLDARASARG